jgi:hypothetical protein
MSTTVQTPKNGTATTAKTEVKNIVTASAKNAQAETPKPAKAILSITDIKKQTERRTMILEQLAHLEESKNKLQSIILSCNSNGETITINSGAGASFCIKNPSLVKRFGQEIDLFINQSIEKHEADLLEA